MGKCENYFADFVITIAIAAIQIGGNSYEASTSCIIKSDFDDGSMSIYFGATIFRNSRKPYSYVNSEAGGKDDENDEAKPWQKEIIRATLSRGKIRPF